MTSDPPLPGTGTRLTPQTPTDTHKYNACLDCMNSQRIYGCVAVPSTQTLRLWREREKIMNQERERERGIGKNEDVGVDEGGTVCGVVCLGSRPQGMLASISSPWPRCHLEYSTRVGSHRFSLHKRLWGINPRRFDRRRATTRRWYPLSSNDFYTNSLMTGNLV